MQNIGGSNDPFYRYKMPDLEVKIEGRGNGIKTVIPNMADIALALKREPAYPTKFFAMELGAVSKWDEKRNVGIVNGAHEKSVLAPLLARFVELFVLCPRCKNPETDLKIKKKDIYQKCLACGYNNIGAHNEHKLTAYILKYPPAGAGASDKKASKKDRRKEKEKKRQEERQGKKEEDGSDDDADSGKDGKDGEDKDDGDNKDDDDDQQQQAGAAVNQSSVNDGDDGEEDGEDGEALEAAAAVPSPPTAQLENVAVSNEDAEDLVDPVELMTGAIASGGSTDEIFEKIRALQREQGFSDEERLQYVFKSIVTDKMAKSVNSNIALLKKVATSEMELLALIEQRCEHDEANLKAVNATLQVLYENDLLLEPTIMLWFEKGCSAVVALADQSTSKKVRKSAKKFIEWLKTADEEEEDDDEES